jgi:nucleotide-binding universal stress UspA family protein
LRDLYPSHTSYILTNMYTKILVAFDGSEASKHALDHAVSIADLMKAEVHIISVVPKVMMPVFPDEGFGAAPVTAAQDLGDYQDRMRDIYGKSLTEAETDIKGHYPDLTVTTKLLEGRPSSSIVDEAENNDMDLIVIGSRGIGGITGWILGSTSRRIVESCTKPVLVVK